MAGSLYRVELGLLWSTLLLSAGVVAMGAVLAGLRVRSPRLHRAGFAAAVYVIPVSATLPVLIRYLRQGTPGQQYVVAAAIAQAAREGVDITPAVPELCTLLEQLRERELEADARWATSSVWFTRADFAPPICRVMRDALIEAGGSGKAAIQYLESVCKKHPIEIFCAEVERFYWAAGGTHIPYRVKLENVRLKSLRTYLVDLAKGPAGAESMAGIRSLARLGVHLGVAADTRQKSPALYGFFSDCAAFFSASAITCETVRRYRQSPATAGVLCVGSPNGKRARSSYFSAAASTTIWPSREML